MRERSTMYATGAGRSALLEADRGGAWLRPLFVVLAAVTLALAATMLVRPGVALAAPSPLVDDTTADFGAGTNNGTQVTGDIGNGAVTLAPDKPGLGEQFDGTELPAAWTVTSVWNAGGTATVANGELTPDAVQVQSDAAFGSDARSNSRPPSAKATSRTSASRPASMAILATAGPRSVAATRPRAYCWRGPTSTVS